MKKILIINSLVCMTLLSSCFVASEQKLSTSGNKYIYRYEMTAPKVDSILKYEDSIITAKFVITSENIIMVLKNNTTKNLKLLWDEVALTYYGKIQSIAHKTTLYKDIGKPMNPVTLNSGGTIEDIILPVVNIDYKAAGQFTGVDWRMKEFFPIYDNNDPVIAKAVRRHIGQQLILRLPFELNEKNMDYTFNFEVKEINCLTCDHDAK